MSTLRLTTPGAFLALILCAPAAVAHNGEDHAAAAPAVTATAPTAGAAPQRLADGSLFVPKPVQYQLGLRTVPATIETLAASVEFNGRVIADPHAGGRVQAAQAGRIEPGPQGLALLGQRVTRGQVLAQLRPLASSIDRGNQQAQLAELEAQLAIAEQRLVRHEQLEGALSQKEIDSARVDVEALRRRRAAVNASVSAAETLVAPVSGVVAAVYVVNGQIVEAREVLFEVIDPARLAVEALAYDPAQAAGIGAADAVWPGGGVPLQFIGAGRTLREQVMPLLFRVRAADVPLAVGQPLKVVARTRNTIRGAALPQSALARNSEGAPVVWVKTAAERFAARAVTTQPLDALTVAVTAGLQPAERVVTEGATWLMQIR